MKQLSEYQHPSLPAGVKILLWLSSRVYIQWFHVPRHRAGTIRTYAPARKFQPFWSALAWQRLKRYSCTVQLGGIDGVFDLEEIAGVVVFANVRFVHACSTTVLANANMKHGNEHTTTHLRLALLDFCCMNQDGIMVLFQTSLTH